MIKREELTFDSRDGQTKVHAVKWIPDGEKPVCILQIIHGMAEHIDRYEEFASFLADKGILVVGDDHLGHGKTAGDHGTYGYFCKDDPATVLVRDEHRLKKTIQEQYKGIPYLILGHSMGSFIARNYLIRYGTGIDGAIIMSTGMQPKSTLLAAKAVTSVMKLFLGGKHVSKMVDKMAFGSYNKRIDNPKTDFDWLSVNPVNVENYIEDPLCGFVFTLNGFSTLFELILRLHDRRQLEKMPKALPVLFVAGDADPVGNYGKAVEEVYQSFKQIGMQNVSMKLYQNGRHEILNEDNRQDIYEDIYRFLLQRIS